MQHLLQQNIENHITQSNKNVYFKNGRGILIVLFILFFIGDNYTLLSHAQIGGYQILQSVIFSLIISAPLVYFILKFCRYYIPKYFKNSHYKKFWKLICFNLIVLPTLTLLLLLVYKNYMPIDNAQIEKSNIQLTIRAYLYFYLYFLSLTGTLFIFECFENIQLLKKTKTEERNLNISNKKHLKNNISPEFMNQSLEEIITLTEHKNEKANDYILQFSNVLRYKLYQINSPRIDIKTSIEALQERVKMHNTTSNNTIELIITGDPDNINVPPVFLLEFYEKLITLAEQESVKDVESHIWIDTEINMVIELVAIKDSNDIISLEEILAQHYATTHYTFEINTTNHHYTLQICLQNLAL